ncbi:hypothetical protein BDM02DRAFT_3194459 [Thelephora ganbajun]|uniref:Uncharacterized protein n=1 Tax=Thelephora ganbajun TaxID=370292 RepID=A0ACB6YWK4_THEGA|nr:hypothetical protein BDM02DRAFT_3194459 [Thelephora ganbajun]
MDPHQPPTPPALHLNIPSPADTKSPITTPNSKGNSTKMVSSAGPNTMQVPGDNASLPYRHVNDHTSAATSASTCVVSIRIASRASDRCFFFRGGPTFGASDGSAAGPLTTS